MNTCNIIGNIVRDPELRYLPNNTPVLDFSIAVNERVKKGDQYEDYANFIDCTAFGKSAESISRYFHQGKQIGITGRLRQDRWEDRETGKNRSKVKVIVDRWCFTGTKADNQSAQDHDTHRREAQEKADRGFNMDSGGGNHEPLSEDDIPF